MQLSMDSLPKQVAALNLVRSTFPEDFYYGLALRIAYTQAGNENEGQCAQVGHCE
jgi:hypothetical protein